MKKILLEIYYWLFELGFYKKVNKKYVYPICKAISRYLNRRGNEISKRNDFNSTE